MDPRLTPARPGSALGLPPRLLTGLACLLLVLPHFIVVVTSFDPSPAGLFPPRGVTLKWYANAFARPAFREAFLLSVLVATVTAACSVVAGVLASLLVVRHRVPGRTLLATLLQSPMMIPEVVLGLGFLILFSRWRMSLSVVNLVLAHVVVTLPYAVRVVSANLYSVGPSIEEAAQVLGAGPVTTFVAVTLPMIRQGMLTAAMIKPRTAMVTSNSARVNPASCAWRRLIVVMSQGRCAMRVDTWTVSSLPLLVWYCGVKKTCTLMVFIPAAGVPFWIVTVRRNPAYPAMAP